MLCLLSLHARLNGKEINKRPRHDASARNGHEPLLANVHRVGASRKKDSSNAALVAPRRKLHYQRVGRADHDRQRGRQRKLLP
eukprot:10856538-Lingulodinium_polyedra.AAC.1